MSGRAHADEKGQWKPQLLIQVVQLLVQVDAFIDKHESMP